MQNNKTHGSVRYFMKVKKLISPLPPSMKHTYKPILLLFFLLQSILIAQGQHIDAYDTTPVSQLVLDTDNDGLLDIKEEELGTNVLEKDTDKDGYFDGEEVHDYGLDPLKQEESIFQKVQAIRLLSIPDNAAVRGRAVFLKGVYFLPHTSFVLSMQSFYGVTKEITVHTDARGIFHERVVLDDFCRTREEDRINLLGEMGFSQHFVLHCTRTQNIDSIKNAFFEHYPVDFASKQHFVIAGALKEGFSAQIPHDYELEGYFSSVVTTAYQLADSATQRRTTFPSRELEEGEHTLTLVLQQKTTGEYMEPIEVHFTLLPDDLFGYLQANSLIVNAFAGVSIASFIALLGILAIGFEKKKNKALRMEIERDY